MVDYLDTFLRPDDSEELRLRLVKLDTRGFAEGESYAVIGLGGGRKEDDRCASPRPRDHGGLDRGPTTRSRAMASRDEHKRRLLQALAVILSKDDDLRRDEDLLEGPDYERWDAARNELVAEFYRRGGC